MGGSEIVESQKILASSNGCSRSSSSAPRCKRRPRAGERTASAARASCESWRARRSNPPKGGGQPWRPHGLAS
eukprot:12507120-Alexandrium_andersonii.AAC.1